MHRDGSKGHTTTGSRERALSGRISPVFRGWPTAAFNDLVGDPDDGHKIVGKPLDRSGVGSGRAGGVPADSSVFVMLPM
jgi:hypothetical protein